MFFSQNYSANFPDNLHSKQDPQPLRQRSAEVLNEGVRSRVVSRVVLLFDINVKKRRGPTNEVA